jgi:two-component system response regulator FixJ
MADDPTVFVVDDDEAVRESLAILLQASGFRVEAFASAEAFLAAHDRGRPGCVLIDVRMPGMDGLELQRALKARDVGLPAIVVTGHGDVPLAVQAMKQGAIDFIEKPYDESTLLAAVRRGLALAEDAAREVETAALARRRMARLTPRELDVLRELLAGRPNKAIARALGISPRTVEIHRARVMEKLEARSLSEAVRLALAAGLETGGA